MTKYTFLLFFFVSMFRVLPSQTIDQKLAVEYEKLNNLDKQRIALLSRIEDLKLEQCRELIKLTGLPKLESGEEIVWHSAMALVYSEENEQAKWVAHVILPDVNEGTEGRSNDFRPDPMVKTGSTVEADYFVKTMKPDSSYEYDGYGYDRGHLAPSADFRWSAKALSESYFYSNMSPQRPDFNRGIWASLEGSIRGYIARNPEATLYVVTGPVLKSGLPKVERSPNGVTIPEEYFKVVYDPANRKAIAFLIPNEGSKAPLSSFAVTIDEVEAETGIDFFSALPDDLEADIESQNETEIWFPDDQKGDVDPLRPDQLSSGQVNTSGAKAWMGDKKKITVCGTVVSARYSNKGNALLNFDKQFPNEVFTLFIRKEHLSNFSYDPVEVLLNKQVCVEGNVMDLSGTPAMFIEDEHVLKVR